MAKELKSKTELLNSREVIVSQKDKSYRINATPSKMLLKRIGESGHNIYEAIAEFIDNAIDAMTPEQKAGEEMLQINITMNAKKKYFSIVDNGRGMSEEELERASQLGYSKKSADALGYAGIGLQSGALTLADNYKVFTAKKGELWGNKFEFDELEWNKTDDWDLPAGKWKKDPEEHGTTIIINKVNKLTMTPAKTQYLKNDIAKRYRSFIQKKMVKIMVNNVTIKVEEINWAEGYPQPFTITTKYGKIYGKVGLMKESSQKGYYGFDMFRNKRMITTNSKFAIGDHPTIARIAGEIYIDFAKVSHEKNKFLETPEYEEAERICRQNKVFKNLLKEARKKSEEGDNKKENIALENYLTKNLPLVNFALKELDYDLPVDATEKEKKLVPSRNGEIPKELIKAIEAQKYKKRGQKTNKEQKKYNETENLEMIELNGKKYNVIIEFLKEKSIGRKDIKLNEENNTLYVYINKGYAGFRVTKDKFTYCFETFIEAIAEYPFKDQQGVVLLNEVNSRKENLITETLRFSEYFRNKYDFKEQETEKSEIETKIKEEK